MAFAHSGVQNVFCKDVAFGREFISECVKSRTQCFDSPVCKFRKLDVLAIEIFLKNYSASERAIATISNPDREKRLDCRF